MIRSPIIFPRCEPQKNGAKQWENCWQPTMFVPFMIRASNIVLFHGILCCKPYKFKVSIWHFSDGKKNSRWENCLGNDPGWPWKTWSAREYIFVRHTAAMYRKSPTFFCRRLNTWKWQKNVGLSDMAVLYAEQTFFKDESTLYSLCCSNLS